MTRPRLFATLLVVLATAALVAVAAAAGGVSARQAAAAAPRPASAGNGGSASQPGDCVDVWALNFSRRGLWIEEALGGNLPVGFPTIDRFVRSEGTATSIKSVDLSTMSYQSQADLERLLSRYIDEVAGFRGGQRSGVFIRGRDVKGRVLVLAIPAGSITAAQQRALAGAAAYARSHGVTLAAKPVAGVRVGADGSVELCDDPAAPAPASWWLTAPLAWQQVGNGHRVLRPHRPKVGEHGPGVAVLPGQRQPVFPPAAGFSGKPAVRATPHPRSQRPRPHSHRHTHHNRPAVTAPAPAPTVAPSPPASVPAMPVVPAAPTPFSPPAAASVTAPPASAPGSAPSASTSPAASAPSTSPATPAASAPSSAPPAATKKTATHPKSSSSHPSSCPGVPITDGICVPPAVGVRKEPPSPPSPPTATAPHSAPAPAPAPEPAPKPATEPSPAPTPSPAPVHYSSPSTAPTPSPAPAHHASPSPSPTPTPAPHVSQPPPAPAPSPSPALGHRNQCLGCEPASAPTTAPASPPSTSAPKSAPSSSGCGGVSLFGACIDPSTAVKAVSGAAAAVGGVATACASTGWCEALAVAAAGAPYRPANPIAEVQAHALHRHHHSRSGVGRQRGRHHRHAANHHRSHHHSRG